MIKQTPFSFYETEDYYVVQEHGKPIEMVYDYLVKRLREMEPGEHKWYGPIDEYFDMVYDVNPLYTEKPYFWPLDYRWISVFAVTGDSEGHYIHVEAIIDDKRKLLFLGKTFQGMDHALKIVGILSKMLEV